MPYDLWKVGEVMKTFTFTVDQVKEIYEAGIRRGEDEAYRYVGSTKYVELYEAIRDIHNDQAVNYPHDWVTVVHVREWFNG